LAIRLIGMPLEKFCRPVRPAGSRRRGRLPVINIL